MYWIFWGQCMLLFFSLEQPTLLQFSPLLPSREQFFTVKELQGCIPHYHMHLLRSIDFSKFIAFMKDNTCYSIHWTLLFYFYYTAGCCWDNLCCDSDFYLLSSPLLDDWIRVDGREMLVVLLLHIHVFRLLHIVRNDDCCPNSWPPNRRHSHVLLPQFLEFVFRLYDCQDGKLYY